PLPGSRQHQDVRHRRAHRIGDDGCEEDVPQPRLVLRRLLSHDGRADGDVHAAVRDRAHQRLGRARHRAAGRRQDHPADGQLCRAGAVALRAAGQADLTPTRRHRPTRLPELKRDFMSSSHSTGRPAPDRVLTDIADYVLGADIQSELAYETARYCLLDTLGCGLEALEYPACTKLLGPIVPGTVVPNGAKVPGTQFQLDPVQAAFNIGAMIRWLDFNDTWLAAEWGHPSDNLGGILATADWLSRNNPQQPLVIRDVLTAMIKAHEIQGVLALENSFNRVGLDHVVLVKVASTAVVSQLLRLNHEETVNAVSLA